MNPEPISTDDVSLEYTTQDLADMLKISKEAAYGLISFLEAKNLVVLAGLRRTNNKGAGAKIYRVEKDLPSKMAEYLAKLVK